MHQTGNRIIVLEKEDIRYPDLLRQIPEPPKQLYCIGNLELLKMPAGWFAEVQ